MMESIWKILWLCPVAILMSLLITCDAWAEDDVNWYRVAANTTLVVDWLQTREIRREDNYFYETNGIMGKSPSESDVDKYFAASILLTNIIGELLPDEYHNTFYLTVAVVETRVITANYALGVRIEF